MNLNSQNILGNSEKIETDNMHEKENIFDSKYQIKMNKSSLYFQNYSRKKLNR
ncbi:hypothetical protein AOB58_2764 (plasmid) [Staphylococcus sp. AntiMn-1]|nr:hypothetical protein AOB58_2764 [Staphylococcus sp. AntiMn-1]